MCVSPVCRIKSDGLGEVVVTQSGHDGSNALIPFFQMAGGWRVCGVTMLLALRIQRVV